MSIRDRYEQYRGYGHGRVISAMNALPVGGVLFLSVMLGLYVGWFIL